MKEHTKSAIESLALSIVALVGLDAREGVGTSPHRCARCNTAAETATDLQPTFLFDQGRMRLNLCKPCRGLALEELAALVEQDHGDMPASAWEGTGAPQNAADTEAPERWTDPDPST